jgi:hypothetical protein
LVSWSQNDHNVLAMLLGVTVQNIKETEDELTAFVTGVFAHNREKRIRVGQFLDAGAAAAHIMARLD